MGRALRSRHFPYCLLPTTYSPRAERAMLHDALDNWVFEHIGLLMLMSAFAGWLVGITTLRRMLAEAYLDGLKDGHREEMREKREE